MQFTENGVHCFFQLSIAIAKIVHYIRIYVVTFNDSIHMWLYLAAKKSLIILARLHHNCKICKLCCTIVNIQTIDVILYDTCNSRSGINTISLINLNEHVKHISQNVATSGARIYQDVIFDTKPICIISPETA